MRKLRKTIFSLLISMAVISATIAQNIKAGFVSVPLNDLSAFTKAGKIWKIASAARAELYKNASMELVKGAGILVGNGSLKDDPNLVMATETGDIELELDFMLAKEAEARIYLQGRYGLQLNDSWARQSSHLEDCGGITERWDDSRPQAKGFEGLAPLMNVCRAPGLWQHLNVVFRAPRLNGQGQKTSNARFDEVYINGVLVQSQVQLSGPAKEALFTDEKQSGPLMLQARKGAIAFRNISYRLINPLPVNLTNISYRYYKGEFGEGFPDLAKLAVVERDTLRQLTWNTGKSDELFAMDIIADLQLPAPDNYTFSLLTYGLGRLYVDNQLVVERITNRWNRSYYRKQVSLAAGIHKFRVVYVKNVAEVKGALAVAIQGVNTDRTELQDKSSTPLPELASPIIINPENRPYLLRSFLNYGNAKLTHVISVGDPGHINYSYDLKQGSVIQVWRGDFLDVTNMWLERGEPQLALPLGSVVALSDAPSLAILPEANAAWPDSVAFDDFQNKGYSLDALRYPTFKYIVNGASVSDKISMAEEGRSLLREIEISNAPPKFFFRVTAANKIEPLPGGLYKVDSKSYYIRIDKSLKPLIRQTPRGSELIVPITNNPHFSYSITW